MPNKNSNSSPNQGKQPLVVETNHSIGFCSQVLTPRGKTDDLKGKPSRNLKKELKALKTQFTCAEFQAFKKAEKELKKEFKLISANVLAYKNGQNDHSSNKEIYPGKTNYQGESVLTPGVKYTDFLDEDLTKVLKISGAIKNYNNLTFKCVKLLDSNASIFDYAAYRKSRKTFYKSKASNQAGKKPELNIPDNKVLLKVDFISSQKNTYKDQNGTVVKESIIDEKLAPSIYILLSEKVFSEKITPLHISTALCSVFKTRAIVAGMYQTNKRVSGKSLVDGRVISAPLGSKDLQSISITDFISCVSRDRLFHRLKSFNLSGFNQSDFDSKPFRSEEVVNFHVELIYLRCERNSTT